MRQEKPRQAPGERRLADAFRPADDPRLRHLVAAVGVEQFMLRRGMTEKRQGLPRMRGVVVAIAFRVRLFAAHCAACAACARKRS